MNSRFPVTVEALEKALQEINFNLNRRIIEKGNGSYVGPHECYGILAEEFNKELLDALHSNNPEQFRKELIDIAVGCIFGMASQLPADTEVKI